ncbi:hypothetical protein GBA63_05035 [Rubrobacter tropicus]|uniref:Uncharacterized protein n=1 Tax=Rubrobacter tropicus TaxID=2653851 RepID=A0A6G8Q6G6_9ACTN|nr:hypothetical protein [Rubrobacter tropicus]QIN82075.1 hypothetical protein GBA63_05035 [Rubrobacter tropicus]
MTSTRTYQNNIGANTESSAPNLGPRLMRAAWLAILLGLGVEVVLLTISVFGGPGSPTFVADLVKSVTWSVFVCVGLAVGTAISRARVPLMGLLGLLSAPAAFEVSRALHKGTIEALALSGGTDAGGTPTILLAVLKGVEYGCLGLAVGWVGDHTRGGAAAHVAAGLAVGAVFGGSILGLVYGMAPGSFSASDLLARGINELLFPVGCALVLFSAKSLGERSTAES